jgi:hypothetical protein
VNTTFTLAELHAEAERRFGADRWNWAFRCSSCGDIATIGEFTTRGVPHLVGLECLGRQPGAPRDRGCEWTSYGLVPGPWQVVWPNGRKEDTFALADPEEAERQRWLLEDAAARRAADRAALGDAPDVSLLDDPTPTRLGRLLTAAQALRAEVAAR